MLTKTMPTTLALIIFFLKNTEAHSFRYFISSVSVHEKMTLVQNLLDEHLSWLQCIAYATLIRSYFDARFFYILNLICKMYKHKKNTE